MFNSFLSRRVFSAGQRSFSAVQKLQKCELTVRTPYRTIFENFAAYTRLYVWTINGLMSIGNKTNPRVYLLPPGEMEVKGIEKGEGNHSKEGEGKFIHSGGWLFVHPNNSVEVNFMECCEKEDFNFEKLGQAESSESESKAGKVATQLQEKSIKNVQRRR